MQATSPAHGNKVTKGCTLRRAMVAPGLGQDRCSIALKVLDNATESAALLVKAVPGAIPYLLAGRQVSASEFSCFSELSKGRIMFQTGKDLGMFIYIIIL